MSFLVSKKLVINVNRIRFDEKLQFSVNKYCLFSFWLVITINFTNIYIHGGVFAYKNIPTDIVFQQFVLFSNNVMKVKNALGHAAICMLVGRHNWVLLRNIWDPVSSYMTYTTQLGIA